MNLESILQRYADREVAPLGGSRRRSLSDTERSALRKDLERIEHYNSRLVWIAVGLLVVLFGAWLVVVLVPGWSAGGVQAASAAFGLSAAGCIRWLLGIWREKTRTALLVRMAVDLEGDSLAAVISILSTRGRPVPS
ncbi:MAG: hypothetical protein K8H90_07490 [Thermoanaerobaculia bacterium]|nr:hypothetical protein [Thermoanaerobaculia bacterium]